MYRLVIHSQDTSCMKTMFNVDRLVLTKSGCRHRKSDSTLMVRSDMRRGQRRSVDGVSREKEIGTVCMLRGRICLVSDVIQSVRAATTNTQQSCGKCDEKNDTRRVAAGAADTTLTQRRGRLEGTTAQLSVQNARQLRHPPPGPSHCPTIS